MTEYREPTSARSPRSVAVWTLAGCALAVLAGAIARSTPDEPAGRATEQSVTGTSGAEAATAVAANAESLSRAFRTAAHRVLPAIVEIKDAGRPVSASTSSFPGTSDSFGNAEWSPFDADPQEPAESILGSGILIDPNGTILTNSHVVRETLRPIVQLADGRRFEALDIKADPDSDLAILQIDSATPLPAAQLGDSDRLQIGDWVLALGSPLDLRQTVSAGIISATGRRIDTAGEVRLLQTDAAINPGSSGGALVDLRGEVVGVTTAIASRDGGYQGIGLAVPSNLAT